MSVPNLIEEIVIRGVPVTLVLMTGGDIGFNINTEAKSGVVLTVDKDDSKTFNAHMRYDEVKTDIETIEDVVNIVKHSMHGREFVADHWFKIFVEFGYAQEKTITKKEFNFL